MMLCRGEALVAHLAERQADLGAAATTRSLLQALWAERGRVWPALGADSCLQVHALASTLCPILDAVVARTRLSFAATASENVLR